ncbi:MAG: MlaD family protein [Muribaculaceae bacterium]|nr:MlaD family protein [Muribaculaceae bacterium]
MKKIFRKEVIIGLIVLLAGAILIVGIDFLKGINVFKAANYYYVSYTNVQGLAKSAPVTVNGFKVGQVREIEYEYANPGHVLVELSLDRQLKVPQGSKAVLSTDLLGTATIALEMSTSPEMHNIGDHLEGVVPKGMMDNVTENLLPSLSGIFPKVDTLLTAINNLVASPELAMSIKRLDAITSNLEGTTRQLNSLMATLPPVMKNVNTITGNLSVSSADLNAVTDKLAHVPVDSIAANLNAITVNLQQLSEQLNDPNSTIGLLTHDPALYRNLNSTVASLDSLFVDIKRNPKRYISIKLL